MSEEITFTDEEINKFASKFRKEGMLRERKGLALIGVPIDPKDSQKGFYWRYLHKLQKDDWDKIDEYFKILKKKAIKNE